jgi:hypothetical protein
MGGRYDSVKALKGIFSMPRYIGQMGCEIPISKGGELPDLHELREQGQLLRGDFLDAFGRLETAVMQYIGKTDVKATSAMPFSQKLTALAKARDRFRNPKRLDVRIAAIRDLLAVRADVVHSALEIIVSFDGRTTTTKLQFQNSSDFNRRALTLSCDEFAAITRRLNQLAAQFSQQRLKEAAPTAHAFST